MGEYDRIQKKQESRAVANNETGSRQLKGFVDNSKSNQLIQRATFQQTGIQADIAALAAARRNGGYPRLGVSAHNFAVGEDIQDRGLAVMHRGILRLVQQLICLAYWLDGRI